MTAAVHMASDADFAEYGDCDAIEGVPLNPRCFEIARQFNKTPEQVAKGLNRHYLESYRRL